MSLRELPPEQAITDKWRHLRYVPLVILLVLIIIATGIGIVVKRTQIAAPAVFPGLGEQTESVRLPDVCHPEVEAPASEPWMPDTAVASAQTWAEHSDELGQDYVMGEDGWVFWNDVQNNNFSQAVGRRFLTADELEQWHTYFADLDTRLAALGTELYIVIAPAKWAIYPEQLPAWAQDLRGSGPLDQLLAAGGDLPLIDLRAQVRDAGAEGQTFSRVNSHWLGYGAWAGWNAIADCIVANQPEVTLAPLELSDVVVGGDSNEFAPYGINNTIPERTSPVFSSEWLPVELSANGRARETVPGDRWTTFDDLPAQTTTSGAASDASVLFLGDSFGVVLSPYLQQAFGTTSQLRHNLDGDPATQPDIVELASLTRPDIVILEIAQRHLNLPPTP